MDRIASLRNAGPSSRVGGCFAPGSKTGVAGIYPEHSEGAKTGDRGPKTGAVTRRLGDWETGRLGESSQVVNSKKNTS